MTGHLEPADGRQPSLWRVPDYIGWWTGNTISALGTSMSGIAYPLLVLFATGSVARAGVISAANLAGVLAATLPGGALADRVSRKAILVSGPLVQAAALGAVAATVAAGRTPIAFLAAMAAISGLVAGIVSGGQVPALRRIVPREQLATATGHMLGRDLAAQLIGTPLGGFLFSVTRWFPFAGDAASFVFASLGAALIRQPLGPDPAAASRPGGIGRDIAEGIRFVRRQPFLRFTIVWGSLLNCAAQAFALLFIALIRYRGAGPAEVGLFTSMALAGGVAGATVAPALARRIRARWLIYGAAWTFTGAFAVAAVVPRPWEIGAAVMVAMFTMVPLNVVLQAYLVRVVPDEFSGRVMATARFGTQGLQWCGPLLAGLLAAHFGVPDAVLALLIPMGLLAIALHVTRSLRILALPLAAATPGDDGLPAGRPVRTQVTQGSQ